MGGTIIGGSSSTGVPWTYIKTVETDNQNVITIDSLPAYDEYMVTGKIFLSSALGNVDCRFNDSAGALYTGNYVANASVAAFTNGTSWNVYNFTATGAIPLSIFIVGKTAAIANGTLGAICLSGQGTQPLSSCAWAGGNAVQLTKITLTGASGRTASAKLEIYGRLYK